MGGKSKPRAITTRSKGYRHNAPPANAAVNDSKVPAELVDYIMDFLHNDKASLSTCATVSRSWLSSSQYHLFRQVKVRLKDDQTLASFVHFLGDNPQIHPLVRKLTFVDTSHPGPSRFAVCPEHVLPGILGKLPHLRHLLLRDVFNKCCCERVTSGLVIVPQRQTREGCFNLETLVLKMVRHGSIIDLFKLIRLFANVQEMDTFCDIVLFDPTAPPPNEMEKAILMDHLPTQLRIRSLVASGIVPEMVHALLSSPTVGSLEVLNLQPMVTANADEHAAIIRECTNLRKVTIGVEAFYIADEDYDEMLLDLRECVCLHTFSLQLPELDELDIPSSIDRYLAFTEAAFDVLALLPSPFPQLVIGVGNTDVDFLRESYAWESLRDYLTNEIEIVTFEIYDRQNELSDTGLKQFETLIKQQLHRVGDETIRVVKVSERS